MVFSETLTMSFCAGLRMNENSHTNCVHTGFGGSGFDDTYTTSFGGNDVRSIADFGRVIVLPIDTFGLRSILISKIGSTLNEHANGIRTYIIQILTRSCSATTLAAALFSNCRSSDDPADCARGCHRKRAGGHTTHTITNIPTKQPIPKHQRRYTHATTLGIANFDIAP